MYFITKLDAISESDLEGLSLIETRTITAGGPILLTDRNNMVIFDSAVNSNLQIPADTGNPAEDFPVGSVVYVAVFNSGHLTVTGAPGVTVVSKDATLNQQYETGRLIKIDDNFWLVCKA